ncbi:MAG: MOSC domain-containing protein [Chloroflexi bacterium]|nr:MOSC domain-containing protein [Chloroflexota bacterium]
MKQLITLEALRAGLPYVRQSPPDNGRLALIVSRPAEDERVVLAAAVLTQANGLEGDTWLERESRHSPDGRADPDRQLTLVNIRALQIISPDETRWPLAGDQLYVDMDLSPENLPPGQRVKVGTAVLEITAAEHRGCLKYAQRFGNDALKFVNQDGWPLRLRGIYARVIQDGTAAVGAAISKIEPANQPGS